MWYGFILDFPSFTISLSTFVFFLIPEQTFLLLLQISELLCQWADGRGMKLSSKNKRLIEPLAGFEENDTGLKEGWPCDFF